jgi:hypothetical protein
LFAAPRNAFGNGPRDDLGIIAGKPFEGQQGAHDLTRTLQVHLGNDGPLDRHVDSLTTGEGNDAITVGMISVMRLTSRGKRPGFANCIAHTRTPPPKHRFAERFKP